MFLLVVTVKLYAWPVIFNPIKGAYSIVSRSGNTFHQKRTEIAFPGKSLTIE